MANIAQRRFALGEVSPKLYSRADLAINQDGLRALRNAIVSKEGGLESRAGFDFKGRTVGDAFTRLVPCVLGTGLEYVLEFTDLALYFRLNGSAVTVTIANWANTTAYVVGDRVYDTFGSYYRCILNHTSNLANDFPGIGPNWTTYWVLSNNRLTLATPYVLADLRRLRVVFPNATSMLILHPSYAPRLLTRVSALSWTLTTPTFHGEVPSLTPPVLSVSGAAGTGVAYVVTTLLLDATGNVIAESLASNIIATNTAGGTDAAVRAAMAAAPRTLSWPAVGSNIAYRVYRANDGVTFYRLVQREMTGPPPTLTYIDNGAYQVDKAFSPPADVTLFASANNYPGTGEMFQQRLLLGGSNAEPDVVRASRTADMLNFDSRSPIQDDDPCTWRQVSGRVNRVLHLLAIGRLLLSMDEIGEHVIEGDTDSVLRPGEVNPRQFSHNGAAANLAPVAANTSALFVQARGAVVRDLRTSGNGLTGQDLMVTASHLTERRTIVAWAYQQTPNSTVWMVLDDGTMLVHTYCLETAVFAWARVDTQGTVEDVCCVPEGTEDALYLSVQRTINGVAVRHVERLANRRALHSQLVHVDACYNVNNEIVGGLTVGTTSAGQQPGTSVGTITITGSFPATPVPVTLTRSIAQDWGFAGPGFGVWTQSPVSGAATWQAIAFAPALGAAGRFVALSWDAGSTSAVATSDDGGETWTVRTTPAAAAGWLDICWSPELALFVAITETSVTSVMTSPDGITWTTRTTTAREWRGVTWSPTLGLFVIVSRDNPTNRVLTSANGIAWTETASGITGGLVTAVAWSPTLALFVAVTSQAATNQVWRSSNGTVWTQCVAPATGSGFQFTAVTWSSVLNLFVAVGIGTNGGATGQNIATSPDGITWTDRSVVAVENFHAVASCDGAGYLVVVGNGGVVYQSTDGIAFSLVSTWLPTDDLRGLAWDDTDGRLVVVSPDSLDTAYAELDLNGTPAFVRVTDPVTGAAVIVDVTAVTSTTVATGLPRAAVPAASQAVAFSTWAFAQARVSGITQLEGETVAASGDGAVVASPNNPAYPEVRIVGGRAQFQRAAVRYAIGLPYTVDVETLDIDVARTSIKDRGILIGGLRAWVHGTRTFFAGPKNPNTDSGLAGLERFVARDDDETEVPVDETLNGVGAMVLQGAWTDGGRVFIRQVDPTPLGVLAIIPEGSIGGRS